MIVAALSLGRYAANCEFEFVPHNLLSKQYFLIFDWSSSKNCNHKIESLNLQFAVFDLVNVVHISRFS